MKHLKIYESFEYSQKIKDKIDYFWGNKDSVKYIIAPPRSKNPESGEFVTTDITLAFKELEKMNSELGRTNILHI